MKHAEDYIDAFVLEAELRDKGKILDLASYPALRRNNSANHISFDFAAFGLGFDFPDELFEDPTFVKVYFAASDMIWWSNVRVTFFCLSVLSLDVDQVAMYRFFAYRTFTPSRWSIPKAMEGVISSRS